MSTMGEILLFWVTKLGVVHMSVGEASKLKEKERPSKVKRKRRQLGGQIWNP